MIFLDDIVFILWTSDRWQKKPTCFAFLMIDNIAHVL